MERKENLKGCYLEEMKQQQHKYRALSIWDKRRCEMRKGDISEKRNDGEGVPSV